MSDIMRRGSTDVLLGAERGKYPDGNSVLVHGGDQRVLIDPSVSIWDQRPETDRVLLTHVHEDHVAGLARYPDTPVAANERDAPHLHSLDALFEMYGMTPEAEAEFRPKLVDEFHFVGRPDVKGFSDGTVFDLGGGVTVTAIPTPGHTRGHTAYLIEPDGVLVIGDIDLTGFGPYYADPVSDMGDFIASMALLRELDAAWYVTFHHKAVIDGHAAFKDAIDAYAAVIDRRDAAILAFLEEPRTMADMVAHRFLYRPGVELIWADQAEERTTRHHLDRMLERGQITELGDDTYVAVRS